MSDGYLNAPKTKLLATSCLICGKALCDATSVEVGIGPECRERAGLLDFIADDVREKCNEITTLAASFALRGDIENVRKCAAMVAVLGLERLAMLILNRFIDAEEKATRDRISIKDLGDGTMLVVTPWKMNPEFVNDWRAIPGRLYRRGGNVIPNEQKPALFALLKKYFPGKYGVGCRGVFRIPEES